MSTRSSSETGAGLDERDAGGGVRREHVAQAVAAAGAERRDSRGEIDDPRARRVDVEDGGLHPASLPRAADLRPWPSHGARSYGRRVSRTSSHGDAVAVMHAPGRSPPQWPRPSGPLAYRHCARPWLTRWGATDDEVDAELPGDELVDGDGARAPPARSRSTPHRPRCGRGWRRSARTAPASTATRGWNASPAAACTTRGPSTTEWQHREAGETVWLAQRYGELGRQVVARLEPERVLAMMSPADYDAIVARRPRDRRVDLRARTDARRSHPPARPGLGRRGGHVPVRRRALRDGTEDAARHQGASGARYTSSSAGPVGNLTVTTPSSCQPQDS